MPTSFTFGATVAEPVDAVRARAETALREEGFGVLTEIDVAATLRAKLGIERPPYLILGVCNPALAHQALEIDPSIGTLLPCTVVLWSSADDATTVEILDPVAALGIIGSDAVAPIAAEAAARLRRVLDSILAG